MNVRNRLAFDVASVPLHGTQAVEYYQQSPATPKVHYKNVSEEMIYFCMKGLS